MVARVALTEDDGPDAEIETVESLLRAQKRERRKRKPWRLSVLEQLRQPDRAVVFSNPAGAFPDPVRSFAAVDRALQRAIEDGRIAERPNFTCFIPPR
jgi:hypothetical protein